MAASRGYGPRNYELWEMKLLAPLRLIDLKSTILSEPPGEGDDNVDADANKN